MTDLKTFLVVEEQALVQIDMAQAIGEMYPDADVLQARNLAEALHLLEAACEGLTGAISGIGVDATRDFGGRVHERGGWVICLNGRHTDLIVAEGWHPLARPFMSEDLQRLIGSLMEQQQRSPAAG